METGLSTSEKEELYFVVLSSSDLSDNRFCRWPTQIELTGPAHHVSKFNPDVTKLQSVSLNLQHE